VEIDILKDLNEVQQEAVRNYEGPSLIVAGAGSGKTRVLTYRIAYLLQQGVQPRSVLALTFTNKAAGEMRERISALVGPQAARALWMGTFHSMFLKILRAESALLGFPSSFTIYDAQDSRNLVKHIIKEMQLDEDVYKPGDVCARISSAKNGLLTPDAYARSAQIVQQDMAARKPLVGEIYRLYAARCFKAGAMDFDDLLLFTNILFRDHPEVLDRYQQKFRYILVDEYQDTNYSQYLIVRKLAQQHHNVCVVGDDSQSIYAFRGARIENILNFRKDYPGFKLFKLEQNYRSTKTIVNAANSLIEKNTHRIPKQVWSAGEDGPLIRVFESESDLEEGFVLAGSINTLKKQEDIGFQNFAILYRTNAQSRIFEEALRKMGIPYRVIGGLSFYQRKEVKDLLAYLRLMVNPRDDESFRRVVNYPARGIGNTTLGRLSEVAAQEGASLWDTAVQVSQTSGGKGPLGRLWSFVELVRGFSGMMETADAYQVTSHVAKESGLLADLQADRSAEGMSRCENIEELLNAVQAFVTASPEDGGAESDDHSLGAYLQNVSLLTDADMAKGEERDEVTLMTVHASKGLEFDVVYLAGMEENLFPSQMCIASAQDIEEERRLFYVGLTRARKYAFLSYAGSRFRWGSHVFCSPSRFIGEIDPRYLDQPEQPGAFPERSGAFSEGSSSVSGRFSAGRSNRTSERFVSSSEPSTPPLAQPRGFVPVRSAASPRPAPSQGATQAFEADDPCKICVGMQVEHQRFGAGEVTAMEGTPPDAKATVLFREGGSKQLLLKFARLKILS